MPYRLRLSPKSMPIVYPSPSPALNSTTACPSSAAWLASCFTSPSTLLRLAFLFLAVSNPAMFRFLAWSCFLFPFPSFCVFVVLLIFFFIADLLSLHLECCLPFGSLPHPARGDRPFHLISRLLPA